jgi:hypothetical protein
MLTEAINEMLAGNFHVGKAMLCCAWMHECRGRRTRRSGRDYVNASITFDGLAKQTGIPSKSLQRMLGPRGNPTAESLFAVIQVLHDCMDAGGRATHGAVAEDAERITLAVKPTRHAA